MIIITGSSRGIGKFLFEKYNSKNCDVVGLFNNSTPDEVKLGKSFKVDITNIEEVQSFVSEISSKLNEVVLINCAGTNLNAFAHKVDLALWKNVIDVNLTGTFIMINAMLPTMRSQGYGRIINLSSIVAQSGIPGTSAYSASKSGLWGMTKALAVENASKNITINNINLGYFNIGMINEVPEVLKNEIINKIPVKKLGDPEEIFKLIEYIISANYLTGTNIDLNGGLF